jgi:hypothetical protein
MPTNVEDIIRKLSPAQRKKVETRAAPLIAEEMPDRKPVVLSGIAEDDSRSKPTDR